MAKSYINLEAKIKGKKFKYTIKINEKKLSEITIQFDEIVSAFSLFLDEKIAPQDWDFVLE